MKKVDTKVELKKYLSQKDKIKNTFISSCIILVVLTFFIFITYSYFINKTGEIEVGNFNSAIPNVEIINKEIVKNTNNRQIIYTIKNNSSSNTYSYNLFYKIKGTRIASIFYKIPSKEYSHPEGIIKPNETKKIFLLSSPDTNHSNLQNDLTTDAWDFKLNSGYEYSKPKIEGGYQKINYSPYSETAELTDLNVPSDVTGYLNPSFTKYSSSYDLLLDYTVTSLKLNYNITNNGEIYLDGIKANLTSKTIDINSINNKILKKRTIKIYAEDGSFVKDISLTTGQEQVTRLIVTKSFGNNETPLYDTKFTNGMPSSLVIHGYESGNFTVNFKLEYISGTSYFDPGDFYFTIYFSSVDSFPKCSYTEYNSAIKSVFMPSIKLGTQYDFTVALCHNGIAANLAHCSVTFTY